MDPTRGGLPNCCFRPHPACFVRVLLLAWNGLRRNLSPFQTFWVTKFWPTHTTGSTEMYPYSLYYSNNSIHPTSFHDTGRIKFGFLIYYVKNGLPVELVHEEDVYLNRVVKRQIIQLHDISRDLRCLSDFCSKCSSKMRWQVQLDVICDNTAHDAHFSYIRDWKMILSMKIPVESLMGCRVG